tara:strand:+ start:173 stop:421 length:249 start_codon:yes stop_codon:yes gene_type:complete
MNLNKIQKALDEFGIDTEGVKEKLNDVFEEEKAQLIAEKTSDENLKKIADWINKKFDIPFVSEEKEAKLFLFLVKKLKEVWA